MQNDSLSITLPDTYAYNAHVGHVTDHKVSRLKAEIRIQNGITRGLLFSEIYIRMRRFPGIDSVAKLWHFNEHGQCMIESRYLCVSDSTFKESFHLRIFF